MTIDEKIKELTELRDSLREIKGRFTNIEGLADNRVFGSLTTAIMDINKEIQKLEEPIEF